MRAPTRSLRPAIPAVISRALDLLPCLLVALGGLRLLALLAIAPFSDGKELEVATQSAHQAVPLLLIAGVLAAAWRRGRTDRGVRLLIAAIGVLATVGNVTDTVEKSLTGLTSWEGSAFLLAAAMVVVVFTPIMNRGAPRSLLLTAWLDTALFLASATVALAVVWGLFGTAVVVPDLSVVGALVTVAAWSSAGMVLLLVREVRFARGGAYAAMAGFGFVAVGGLAYLATLNPAGRSPFNVAIEASYLGGMVLVAWGGLQWTLERDPRMRGSLAVALLREALPTIAIMGAIVVYVLAEDKKPQVPQALDIARAALVAGVVLAGAREMLLRVYERRAVAAEKRAEAEVAAHVGERRAIAKALAGLEVGDTVTETADRICERAAALPGMDFAVFTRADGAGGWTTVAAAGIPADDFLGEPVPEPLATHMTEQAAGGAWRQATMTELHGLLGIDAPGEVMVIPLHSEGGTIGLLAVGSRASMHPDDAERRLAATREVGVVAAALLAPALSAEAAARARADKIDRLITDEAFYPVFQPIVDLATREVKGFEALTRFTDGTRPDHVFEEASAAGRGVELELATLGAAMRECVTLPRDTYVSINLSAELASRPELLGPILTRMPRDLLLEITEHVQVTDYEILIASLYALDLRVRIAVDDAGSGYAGLSHILAVRPHVVKLDQSLVRSVDLDLARQALVGSMVTFTGRTGSVVVAEGIETEGEARMLLELGAQLGQGYLFGRPERAPAAVPAGVPAGATAPGAN
jgi:EAL domain-containing protein (putative c-di-GMP-specific phosphodiesterase class I)